MKQIAQKSSKSLVSAEEPTVFKLKTSNAVATLEPSDLPTAAKNPLDSLLGPDLPDEAANENGPIAQLGRDDRKSARIPVPTTRQACEVKTRGHALPGLLMDRSEGGFAVVMDRVDGFKPGMKIELRTDIGCFTVRIVYINKVTRPKEAQHGADSWFRLGLKKSRSVFPFF
jgi:hypothetical protein